MDAIDFKKLKELGIRHIVFDKDNTLTFVHERQYMTRGLGEMVVEVVELFGKGNVAILSNSIGSKDDAVNDEAKVCEETLGLPVIRHKHKKPNVLDEILNHFGNMECEPGRIAVIGDRILSDVIMGNQFGFFTIYVYPTNEMIRRENIVVRTARLIEDNLIPKVVPASAPNDHFLIARKDIASIIRKDLPKRPEAYDFLDPASEQIEKDVDEIKKK